MEKERKKKILIFIQIVLAGSEKKKNSWKVNHAANECEMTHAVERATEQSWEISVSEWWS